MTETSGHDAGAGALTTEALIERAREQSLALNLERAERLLPKVRSLLARLARLAEALPRETAPPSGSP